MLSTHTSPDIAQSQVQPYADNEDYATLEGYGSFHTIRTGARSGGGSVFYKEKYKTKFVTNLTVCNLNIESCFVCIYIGSVTLTIVGIYRPHSGTIEYYRTCFLSGVLDLDMTDHCDIFVLMSFPTPSEGSERKVTFRMQSDDCLDKLRDDLRRSDWNFDRLDNICDKVEYFDRSLNDIYMKN